MKKLLYTLVGLVMLILVNTAALAQVIVGESDPFVFDTRETVAVPISSLAVILFLALAGFYFIRRYHKEKTKMTA